MKNKSNSVLVDVAMAYATENEIELSESVIEEVRKAFTNMIKGIISDNECAMVLKKHGCCENAVNRIREILLIREDDNSEDFYTDASQDGEEGQRKRAKLWNADEDKRLLAAIHKHSLNDWISVSRFVGNGRNRSQCSQRWFRCLDPRIEKSKWTSSEDQKLRDLVKLYGDHSWAKVASKMGSRSDVQCRYRWFRFLSDTVTPKKASYDDYNEEETLKHFSQSIACEEEKLTSFAVKHPKKPAENVSEQKFEAQPAQPVKKDIFAVSEAELFSLYSDLFFFSF